LPADVLVGEDHFIDAVEVPLVVGGHLVDPLGLAAIHVASPDRHRPAIVARALLRTPGRGLAGPVVPQIHLRIVGIPLPARAAPPVSPLAGSPCFTDQATCPVLASSATSVVWAWCRKILPSP